MGRGVFTSSSIDAGTIVGVFLIEFAGTVGSSEGVDADQQGLLLGYRLGQGCLWIKVVNRSCFRWICNGYGRSCM